MEMLGRLRRQSSLAIGAKIIKGTTSSVGELISELHTHMSYTTLIVEE